MLFSPMLREGTAPDSQSILEYTQVTSICEMFADDCTEHILSGKNILLDLSCEEEKIQHSEQVKFIKFPNFCTSEASS